MEGKGPFGVPADKAPGQPRHAPVTTPTPPRWTGSPGPRSSALVMAGAPGSRGAGWQHVCHSAAGTHRSLPGAGCPSRTSLSRGSTGLPPTCPEKDKTVSRQRAFQTDRGPAVGGKEADTALQSGLETISDYQSCLSRVVQWSSQHRNLSAPHSPCQTVIEPTSPSCCLGPSLFRYEWTRSGPHSSRSFG